MMRVYLNICQSNISGWCLEAWSGQQYHHIVNPVCTNVNLLTYRVTIRNTQTMTIRVMRWMELEVTNTSS